jgi:hypothetical protein
MLVMMVLSYALAPKPKTQSAAVQEGEVPTASASDPIPVVFGEVELSQQNVVWWGDPNTVPIKTKSGK